MSAPVRILLGSDSDWEVVEPACETLDQFGLDYEVRVLSAHRSPEALQDYVRRAEQEGARIFLAAAGGAAHLPGVVAAHTALPVLGIPVPTQVAGGLDSLLSICQMPAGVPVATMAIGHAGARNAALFAVRILSLSDPRLREQVQRHRQELSEEVRQRDERLQAKIRAARA